MDKASPEFWLKLDKDSVITLSDEEALDEAMEKGEGIKGIDYLITNKKVIRYEDKVIQWVIFEIEGEDEVCWFMVKIVDEELDFRVYYQPEGFEPGSRADLVERGLGWLFEPPEDEDDFVPGELEYARYPNVPPVDEEEEDSDEVSYVAKPPGPLYARCKNYPGSSSDPGFITVVEYSSEEDCSDPEMLVLEEGGLDEDGDPSPHGGWVTILLGTPLESNEVDVLDASHEQTPGKVSQLKERLLRKLGR